MSNRIRNLKTDDPTDYKIEVHLDNHTVYPVHISVSYVKTLSAYIWAAIDENGDVYSFLVSYESSIDRRNIQWNEKEHRCIYTVKQDIIN